MNTQGMQGQGWRTESDEPAVKVMVDAISGAVARSDDWRARARASARVRLARWAGQQDNGRKGRAEGTEPWPEASDVRIRLVDELINDTVVLAKRVVRGGTLQVAGTEGGDFGNAGKVSIYLEHLRRVKLRKQIVRQEALAAQWRAQFGHAITMVTWRQEFMLDTQALKLEELQQLAQQNPDVQMFIAALFDPEAEAAAVGWLQTAAPDLDNAAAKAAIAELRETGATKVPVRAMKHNEPRWRALKPFRDVFYPANTGEIQRAPWVAVRTLLTEADLWATAAAEAWQEGFVEALLEHSGKTLVAEVDDEETPGADGDGQEAEDRDGLFEVFYLYHRLVNRDGFGKVQLTVLAPELANAVDGDGPRWALDVPLGYNHGLYPFVERVRETIDNRLLDSRGIPELANTHQSEIKCQRDGRVNLLDLQMQPPVLRPVNEIGLALTIRPRGEIGVRRGGAAAEFMRPPPYAPGSVEMENNTRLDVDRYFGRNVSENPSRAGSYAQDLADDFAEEHAECWRHTLMLAQQFESEMQFERVVGTTRTPITLSAEEIRGAFDVQVSFNTATLDNAHLVKRLEVLNGMLLPMDRGGVIDLAPMVTQAFGQLFPEMADTAVRSVATATAAEAKDEQDNWARMVAGVEPEMAEKGQNFQLRLQVLQQILQNPLNQQRATAAPDTQKLVERRMKHLQFMVQQGQNANTGRVGV